VTGHALRPATTAVSIRDNVKIGGSLADGAQTLAGYLLEAFDFDHATWIARMVPVADGWGEVRPPVTA